MKNESPYEYLNEKELLEIIDSQNLPGHIAIIMDGNGRWAQKKGLPRFMGHQAGAESLKEIILLCCDLKIKVLTVYGFSTENWKRPKEEVNSIMNLIVDYLNNEIKELCRKGVRVNHIGGLGGLPEKVGETLSMAGRLSRDNSGLVFNVALNYGGRQELTDAVCAIASSVAAGRLKAGQINAGTVSDHLYTAGQPDPDLIIRTSGVSRISNFLLWQSAYSEICITEVLWPDFKRRHLLQALADYQQRERRYGGLKLN